MKTLKDCMKRNVISVSVHATVHDAIRACVSDHIGTLPVIDDQGTLVGTLRMADLVGLGMPDFFQVLDHLEFIHSFGAMEVNRPDLAVLEQPVTEVMRVPVVIEENGGLLRASALLYKNQLTDIPVVDADHHLVGIASRVDIGVALMEDWLTETPE
jgi:CBS-domain-containing membrane protein